MVILNLTNDEINKLINVAVATIQVESIKTPYKKIRPYMHILIHGGVGTGKSTILQDIRREMNTNSYIGLTKSHLTGSVDKLTGIFIPPIIWECRNNVVLIDEYYLDKFDKSGKQCLNDLLTLMEDPYINKKVGYRCNTFEEEDGDLFCIAKDSRIRCNTKFILFMNTMMNLEQKAQMREIEALMSRCICIPYYPTGNEIFDKLDGKNVYKFKKYKVKKNVKINKTLHEKLKNFLKKKKLNTNKLMRTYGDLCRAYAVVGFDEKMFDIIVKLAYYN